LMEPEVWRRRLSRRADMTRTGAPPAKTRALDHGQYGAVPDRIGRRGLLRDPKPPADPALPQPAPIPTEGWRLLRRVQLPPEMLTGHSADVPHLEGHHDPAAARIGMGAPIAQGLTATSSSSRNASSSPPRPVRSCRRASSARSSGTTRSISRLRERRRFGRSIRRGRRRAKWWCGGRMLLN